MAAYQLLCFIVIMALQERGGRMFVATDDVGCTAIALAAKMKTLWKDNDNTKSIQWFGVKEQPSKIASCSRDPAVSELGDVSRIDIAVAKNSVISNKLCSGCPGEEVVDAEYRFSTNDLFHGNREINFGPCKGITVYRCRCPERTNISDTTIMAAITTRPTVASVENKPAANGFSYGDF